jgi:hypothetical protein
MKKICKEKGMMEEHKCDHPKGEPCTDLCKYETKEDCKPKAEKKDCHKK